MPIEGRLLLEVLWYIFQILTCQYITIQYSYYTFKHVVVNLFSMLRCIDFLLETYQTIVVSEYQTKLTTIPGLSQWHHWHQDIVRVSVSMNIWCDKFMMPSSKGNISTLLGHCEGNHRWIPLTKASDAGLWCFLWSALEQTVEWIIGAPVILDAIAPIMISP